MMDRRRENPLDFSLFDPDSLVPGDSSLSRCILHSFLPHKIPILLIHSEVLRGTLLGSEKICRATKTLLESVTVA